MLSLAALLPAHLLAHDSKPDDIADGGFEKENSQSQNQFEERATIDQIIVYGRGLEQIGIATSGSQGTVGYADFEGIPISRIGELVENVPGLIATQHSGTGKANQYFLRGFNLDHGTDLAGFVDDVPINMRSHGHGQGYLDFNFLITETVERIDFRKGPYFADAADFTAAGTISFQTFDTLAPFAKLQFGEFGFVRGVAGGSFEAGAGELLLAFDGQLYDGPWVLDEDLERVSALAKYSIDAKPGRFEIQINGYRASWTSTDQVAERAVSSGAIDRFGFLDDDLGGETTRIGAVVNGDLGATNFNLFATYYDFQLVSNFTYFLEDPVNGDEFIQTDERVVLGAAVTHIVPLARGKLRFGADLRHDAVDEVGLFRSIDAVPQSATRRDRIDQTSVGVFGALDYPLLQNVRATAGLRYDAMFFDVEALRTPNSGSGDDGIVTPSFSLAWQPIEQLELYANYGHSFHSNDMRGATISFDPASGEVAQRVPVFARAEGAELGARLETDRFTAALVAFGLELDSELVFVGDAGATEPNDGSRRYGLEVNAFWRPTNWLALDAAYSYTNARFVGPVPGERDIPGAVPQVLSAGANFDLTNRFAVNLQLRHFGSAPLIEDGSVRSDPTTLVNLAGRWRVGAVEMGVELFNLLDTQAADITYFYQSRLAGELSQSISDRHFHPVEPFQIRGSLSVSF